MCVFLQGRAHKIAFLIPSLHCSTTVKNSNDFFWLWDTGLLVFCSFFLWETANIKGAFLPVMHDWTLYPLGRKEAQANMHFVEGILKRSSKLFVTDAIAIRCPTQSVDVSLQEFVLYLQSSWNDSQDRIQHSVMLAQNVLVALKSAHNISRESEPVVGLWH